jgi:hypothetical protein
MRDIAVCATIFAQADQAQADAEGAPAQQLARIRVTPAVEDKAAQASPQPAASAADAAAAGGVRVTASFRDVTSYALWVNWKDCLEGYPDVKPRFYACGDQQFVQLEPARELTMNAVVTGVGVKKGTLDRIKLAQQLVYGHIVFEAGISLPKVSNADVASCMHDRQTFGSGT